MSKTSASEMTYIVSRGALNSTNSTHVKDLFVFIPIGGDNNRAVISKYL